MSPFEIGPDVMKRAITIARWFLDEEHRFYMSINQIPESHHERGLCWIGCDGAIENPKAGWKPAPAEPDGWYLTRDDRGSRGPGEMRFQAKGQNGRTRRRRGSPCSRRWPAPSRRGILRRRSSRPGLQGADTAQRGLPLMKLARTGCSDRVNARHGRLFPAAQQRFPAASAGKVFSLSFKRLVAGFRAFFPARSSRKQPGSSGRRAGGDRVRAGAGARWGTSSRLVEEKDCYARKGTVLYFTCYL